jgi:phospholipid/cholesterol/gamma-HCH transport system substrate-binding protein
MLIALIIAVLVFTAGMFTRSFRSYVPVTVTAPRAGLILETNAKVKFRGVEVGRVSGVAGGKPVRLKVEIYSDQTPYIPANVEAQIMAPTAFGPKFVDLVAPENPSAKHLAAGAVVPANTVSTEANTIFENLVGVLKQIDPAKLNGILSALGEGLRGQGPAIGQAITDANEVLQAINPRSETIREDWHSFKAFSDTYGAAAQNILATLDAVNTTGETITSHAKALDSLLLNATGLSNSGINLLSQSKDNLIRAVNVLEPTTNLLLKYNPEYTCMLLGAKWGLDNGFYAAAGGNGKSVILDVGILLGNDPYVYPDNLPIVAAKNGPGGKPGCGSLPDASKNFPVRQLVTNTGWGTGTDLRGNVGLGHPCYANYFPVTRAVPEPPSVRCQGPPSPDNPWPPPGPLPPELSAPAPPAAGPPGQPPPP